MDGDGGVAGSSPFWAGIGWPRGMAAAKLYVVDLTDKERARPKATATPSEVVGVDMLDDGVRLVELASLEDPSLVPQVVVAATLSAKDVLATLDETCLLALADIFDAIYLEVSSACCRYMPHR